MIGKRRITAPAPLLMLLVSDLASPRTCLATAPTTAETRAEFEAVCRRLTEGDNYFFGRKAISAARDRLSDLPDDHPDLLAARIELGYQLIRFGEHREAIAVLEAGLDGGVRSGRTMDDPAMLAALQTLAVAHLQLAEDENCIALHASGSCILPIGRQAVHRRPEHSRAAGDLYQRYLEHRPDDLQARWLLNLARMISGDYPNGVPDGQRLPAEALVSTVALPHWQDISSQLGVDAFDLAGGAIMDDFDGDGLLDLVSSSWDPCEPIKAFRNDGRGGFENVAETWGLDAQWGGLNILQADFDNDGRLDLLVLRGAWLGAEGRLRNSLLRNDLGGAENRFVDVTALAGLAYPAYPTQAAAWADYDGDGDLDLFIGNEAGVALYMTAGEAEDPYPSQLFRNNGDGTFTDIARRVGVINRRFAKGAAWGDFDNDGDADLYVSNFGPNRLYRNNGEQTFVDVAEVAGVAEPAGGSFATWFFDYDNDGWLDIFVADYSAPMAAIAASQFGRPTSGGHPVLYRNTGDGFIDVSRRVGFDKPHLPMGANFGDLDNDGWLDFYLGTGVPNFEALMPNAMYRNDRGRKFDDVSYAGGFAHLQKGHGVAFGDLDNDGDEDLFHQLGGAFPFDAYGNALFANPGQGHHWLVLRLEGRQANRFAVGARIKIELRENGSARAIYRVVGSGGSFGGSSLQQEIGLGQARAVERVTVEWPGSARPSVFERPEPDRFYLVTEGDTVLHPLSLPRLPLGRNEGPPSHHHEDPQP